MTNGTRRFRVVAVLRRVLGYAVLYLAAFALFYLFGLSDSFVRPLIPLSIAVGIDYWESRRMRGTAG
jgi:hypothetical protein